MRVDREHQLYEEIARYMQREHPKVVYRFDIAADLKLTKGQAVKFKRLHPNRGYPDLFIAYPVFKVPTKKENQKAYDEYGYDVGMAQIIVEHLYAGLYLELKAEGNSPFKKDGSLKKDKHLEEQQAMLEWLRKCRYKAEFATGFEEAKRIIEDYLKCF